MPRPQASIELAASAERLCPVHVVSRGAQGVSGKEECEEGSWRRLACAGSRPCLVSRENLQFLEKS